MSSRAAVMASLVRKVEQAVVQDAINVQAALTEAAPVDTGFLANNFQLSVGAPAEGTVALGEATIAGIVGYTLKDGSAFITNNTNYAAAVNARGKHVGFVEAAIAEGLSKS